MRKFFFIFPIVLLSCVSHSVIYKDFSNVSPDKVYSDKKKLRIIPSKYSFSYFVGSENEINLMFYINLDNKHGFNPFEFSGSETKIIDNLGNEFELFIGSSDVRLERYAGRSDLYSYKVGYVEYYIIMNYDILEKYVKYGGKIQFSNIKNRMFSNNPKDIIQEFEVQEIKDFYDKYKSHNYRSG